MRASSSPGVPDAVGPGPVAPSPVAGRAQRPGPGAAPATRGEANAADADTRTECGDEGNHEDGPLRQRASAARGGGLGAMLKCRIGGGGCARGAGAASWESGTGL